MRLVIQWAHGTAWEGDDRQEMDVILPGTPAGWRFRFMGGLLVRFWKSPRGLAQKLQFFPSKALLVSRRCR